MLRIGNQCRGTIARVHVILLDAEIAPDCEQCSSGSIIADGSDAVNSRDRLVGNPLSAHIPCTGLSEVASKSANEVVGGVLGTLAAG
jgi:hypothetical protein